MSRHPMPGDRGRGRGRPTEALAALASWGLPGAPALRSPDDEADALALVAWSDSSRLLGPLSLGLETGAVSLPPAARQLLAERHEASLWWSLAVERRLLELRARFDRAGGVEHLVVKGTAVAHLDEGDPSLRSFADLDLLVRSRDLDRAVAALRASGATRSWSERRPAFDRRFAKSVTLLATDGIEVDLHRSLCDGAHGFRIPLDRLFADPDRFTLGGERVETLNLVHRVLHAAYHAVLGSPAPKLMSLRDLAGYLTRDDVSVTDVVAEARRWRGEAVLATALAETWAALSFDAPVWADWLGNVEVDPDEQAIVDRQRRQGSSPGRAHLDGLPELGLAERAAYLYALAVPSREHLHSRQLTLGRIYLRRLRLRRPRRRADPRGDQG